MPGRDPFAAMGILFTPSVLPRPEPVPIGKMAPEVVLVIMPIAFKRTQRRTMNSCSPNTVMIWRDAQISNAGPRAVFKPGKANKIKKKSGTCLEIIHKPEFVVAKDAAGSLLYTELSQQKTW